MDDMDDELAQDMAASSIEDVKDARPNSAVASRTASANLSAAGMSRNTSGADLHEWHDNDDGWNDDSRSSSLASTKQAGAKHSAVLPFCESIVCLVGRKMDTRLAHPPLGMLCPNATTLTIICPASATLHHFCPRRTRGFHYEVFLLSLHMLAKLSMSMTQENVGSHISVWAVLLAFEYMLCADVPTAVRRPPAARRPAVPRNSASRTGRGAKSMKLGVKKAEPKLDVSDF